MNEIEQFYNNLIGCPRPTRAIITREIRKRFPKEPREERMKLVRQVEACVKKEHPYAF